MAPSESKKLFIPSVRAPSACRDDDHGATISRGLQSGARSVAFVPARKRLRNSSCEVKFHFAENKGLAWGRKVEGEMRMMCRFPLPRAFRRPLFAPIDLLREPLPKHVRETVYIAKGARGASRRDRTRRRAGHLHETSSAEAQIYQAFHHAGAYVGLSPCANASPSRRAADCFLFTIWSSTVQCWT